MAKISANGAHEVLRWTGRTGSRLLRSDGTILARIGDSWKLWARVKDDVTIEQYAARVHELATAGRLLVGVTTPSTATLRRWMDEGGCKATDGCWVEPDGTCPHGHKSWLLVQGLI